MMIKRAALGGYLLLPVLLLLGGCSTISSLWLGSDNSLPPAPLPSLGAGALQPAPLWQRDVGSGIGDEFLTLRPAVDGESLFAAGYDGEVVALTASNGELRWQRELAATITGGVGLGPRHVYVGTRDGVIYALDRDDGSEAWQAQVSSEVLAPPQVDRNIVVVRTLDGQFFALDALTGQRLWLYQYTVPALSLRGTAAPLLSQGVVISGLDNGNLLILSLNSGERLGETTIAPPVGRTELDRMVDIDSTPILVDDILYIASYQGNAMAVDLRASSVRWQRAFSSYAGLVADRSGVYAVDDEDRVWALDPASGAPLWTQEALRGRRLTHPILTVGALVVGDLEGYLHWLDRSDGSLLARWRLGDDGFAAAPVWDNGTIYALGRDGELAAVRLAN